ncbi:restriction endonuclease subunit S [Cecembia calidifontis]|uniref:Type I restriction enzyme S subunit n=1 Tax=Cecembia calidifontis TaxID=1187080 RepID=A0A4Q7PEP6_9BACT|nr:restriction endonuclease subunit S [Cecembia calidifontis]RZS98597.1 type I restriction enzyme S subunit [Cecembia calidifontis]
MMETRRPKLRWPGFNELWERNRLGKISKLFSGGTPSSSQSNLYGGEIPFIRSGEINSTTTELFLTEKGLMESSAKMVNKGDLLYAIYGATSGEVAISKIRGAINQAILCIRPDIEKEFLKNWLLVNKEKILNKFLQGGQGNLSGEIVKSLEVCYPSLPEQQKIASFLSSVDERIELLERKKEKLEAYKKGVMQQIFTQQIRFKQDDGSEFPDWEEKRLGEVVKVQGGFAFKSEKFKQTGIPVIRISNISNNNNFIETENLVFYDTIKNDVNFTINKGDLLIAMSGATTGKSSIYNLNDKAYLNQRVGLFKRKSKSLCYAFLIQFVFSTMFKNQLKSLLVAGAQPNISSSDIESIKISLPEFEEQEKIAAFLNTIDENLETLDSQIQGLRTWKKGLLQQMFV